MILRGVIAALMFTVAPAAAGGVAGDFDFYVLSLSWSPTYCASDPDPAECGLGKRGFVVHGLWPQYESGYPDYCLSDLPRGPNRATIDGVSDFMPSAGLARYQWRKHGICSGLDADDYFALMRRAVARVAIPDAFADRQPAATMSPKEIEAAFATANPGLSSAGMSVQCRRGIFTEIRLCMTVDLAFRRCIEVDRDGCRSGSIVIPPVE